MTPTFIVLDVHRVSEQPNAPKISHTRRRIIRCDTASHQALVEQLLALQKRVHAPPTEQALCVSTGSQEALTRAFAMLVNPGEAMLVENPTYSGSLAYLKPMGCELVGLDTDGEGLVPAALAATLEGWANGPHAALPKPRVLYTIPTGANPTGGTMRVERRREVYRLAREHDLLILEDDP